jgi:ribosome-associated protein
MGDLFINSRLILNEKELAVSTARSSGPGGQNVNKVNSKVTLRWNPTACEKLDPAWRRRFLARNANRINRSGEIVVHSDRYRDQLKNLRDVRQKLVSMLLECQAPPKVRKATRPTKGSQRRRLEQKRQQSEKKASRRRPLRDD